MLLPNTAEYSFWLAAAALGRFVLVGLNPTRSDADLASDVEATACRLVLTDTPSRILGSLDPSTIDYPAADLPEGEAEPADLYLLIFTSGTTGTPKAVRCSQGKIAWSAHGLVARVGLDADDVSYVSMPLFHSGAVIAGWAPTLAVGGTVVLREKFSASGFLPDVREHGCTYAHYVGTPLSYVLAQPPASDDADNPLRLVFGNEGAPADISRFASRFGCRVIDGFGSSEGGISISRTPETPAGALGVPNGDVRVLDPSGVECGVGEIGQLVNMDGLGTFEGYWDAPVETAHRNRDGRYWSGDLGHRDADGFLWFAGRSGDRLRVGGENFTAAPIAALLGSHPDVIEAVVYAVPDATAGDQVMAAVVPADGLDPSRLAGWVADTCAIWAPRYVRVSTDLPRTATGKVVVRELVRRRWEGDDVWCRDARGLDLRPMTSADCEALEKSFADSGRVLPG